MKQGKKLTRKIKEYLSSKDLDPKKYLLERQGNEDGYDYFQVINLETNKTEKYYL